MKKVMLKRIAVLFLSMALLCSLSACGAGSSNTGDSGDSGVSAGASDSASYDGGYYDTDSDQEEISEASDSASDENASDDSDVGTNQDQKLVYKATLHVETLAYQETMEAIYALVNEVGGIIASESTTDSNYSWYRSGSSNTGTMTTNMTVRVPSNQYTAFINGVDGSGGRVTSRTQNVENITRTYNDQTVLVSALETQEERLQNMMKQAQTIDEMISIEERLTSVQTQLNQAKSYLASLEKDVAYSTVTLNIREVHDYTDTNTETTSYAERVKNAVKNSASSFLQFMQDLTIILIELLPYLIFFGIIIWIIICIIRWRRRKHPRDKEKKPKKQKKQKMVKKPNGGRFRFIRTEENQESPQNDVTQENQESTQNDVTQENQEPSQDITSQENSADSINPAQDSTETRTQNDAE